MKRIPKSKRKSAPGPLLAFGAHPDDLEFGCGGVLIKEAMAGRKVHLVVCSYGEAASHGTPEKREAEARRAAKIMGATVQFVFLDGDSHLEMKATHAISMAWLIRRHRPAIVLAPTLVENQHPDHWRLGKLVRDGARLARYGGIEELKGTPAHAIGQLLFYAVTPGAEPKDQMPVLVDVSAPKVMATWTRAIKTHVSQARTRDYLELVLTRARLHGFSAGVGHAIALFPNDPLIVESLGQLGCGARVF